MAKRWQTYVVVAAVVAIIAGAYLLQNPDLFQPSSLIRFKVTIYYTDGTSYSPSSVPLPKMAILDPNDGKVVSSIQTELYVHPTFSGSVTSWRVTTLAKVQVYNAAPSLIFDGAAQNITTTGGAISSGTDVLVTSSTMSASTLESMASYLDGEYYYYALALASPVTMTINFASGSPSSATLSQSSTSNFQWRFQYLSGNQFLSLGVAWNLVPS